MHQGWIVRARRSSTEPNSIMMYSHGFIWFYNSITINSAKLYHDVVTWFHVFL